MCCCFATTRMGWRAARTVFKGAHFHPSMTTILATVILFVLGGFFVKSYILWWKLGLVEWQSVFVSFAFWWPPIETIFCFGGLATICTSGGMVLCCKICINCVDVWTADEMKDTKKKKKRESDTELDQFTLLEEARTS